MQFLKSKRMLLAASVIACGTVAVWVGTRKIVAQQLGPRPITVTYVESEYDVNGSLIARTQRLLAVRSDGSQVEPRSVKEADGRSYEQRTIWDTQKRKRIVVDGITESLTTYMLSGRELAGLRKPAGACTAGLGATQGETVLGYTTVRTELRTPLRVIHRWLAPDLGCVALRENVSRPKSDGTTWLARTRESSVIALGEPDSALFDVPEWPESTPSQVFARYRQKFGLPAAAGDQVKADRDADLAYWAQQKERP